MNQKQFAIIGGGSWGTAIASMISRAWFDVLIYTNDHSVADEINTKHTNGAYLDDIDLGDKISATTNLVDLLRYKIIIIATPSHVFENIITQLKELNISKSAILLIATKGLCQSPIQLFSQKIEQCMINEYGFISGPNFAKEVAQGSFSSITITSKNIALAGNISKMLISKNLDIVVSDDIITIQIAGIVKNIIAIKSGILQAQGAGQNARAWLISQGLREISIISNKLGGQYQSLYLPAVVGDLVLTSYSIISRNAKFGFDFHNSNYSKSFLTNYPVLVEGIQSAKLLSKFVQDYNLDLPIIFSIAALV